MAAESVVKDKAVFKAIIDYHENIGVVIFPLFELAIVLYEENAAFFSGEFLMG